MVGHAFEGVHLTNTRQAAHTYLPFLTLHVMHKLAHTNQFPSSFLGKPTGPSDILGSRVGWTHAIITKEHPPNSNR